MPGSFAFAFFANSGGGRHVAEREVRGLLERIQAQDRRARGLVRAVPRADRIVSEIVSVEAVADLGDRLPLEQWGDPKLLVHQMLHQRTHVPFSTRRRKVPLVVTDLVYRVRIVL